MKENISVPWKRIVLSSTISILMIFLLGFIDALLCSNFAISLEMGKILMYIITFCSVFVGNFFVKAKEKRIIYALISALITFAILNILGLFTSFPFSGENTLLTFIVICISAIINCIIKGLFR